jgi:bacillopeptidase F
MKKTFLFILLLLFVVKFNFAQEKKISSQLDKAFSEKDAENKYYRVSIFLKEKANIDSLDFVMKQLNLPPKERAKSVADLLIKKAIESQQNLISEISKHIGATAIDIQSFWIVNMLIVEAKPDLILKLSKSEDIELIDLDNSKIVSPIDPPVSSTKSYAMVGGKEPGLVAINAPAMWAMGYTGRGRIACSIDTGVWPNHPAIKNNFLASYVPLSQAWLGYQSNIPKDKPGSHGTHTVGTEMGLDRATNDTIGVAYNSFFIATDPVATSLAEAQQLSAFLIAFQWVFNPDGDTATTDDIPDVTNNSWGYDVPTDTLLCNGFISQMFSALEAGGIACVFSAGNSGPDVQTISSPHHVTLNEVNSFTVGAVNGNIATYPIASFSSRGPTICNVDSALKIKPEVVAPGEIVRSSINQNKYAGLSGTSMAAPHVTGAVLLLKEAFPDVMGYDILRALYYTAHDLGVTGEDNTYGRGMIDVMAAFNYLSQTHTPTPPLSKKYDIAVTEISNINLPFYCTKTFTPQIIISNLGDSTLYNAKIYYRLNNETQHIQNWTGNLQSNQTVSVNLTQITALNEGNYELIIKIVNDSNVVEYNRYNNSKVARFAIKSEKTLPYFQNYENGNLGDNEWLVNNPDYAITWDTITTAGLPNSNRSAYIKLSNYSPLSSQKDQMISPAFIIPDSNDVSMNFQLAYHYSGLADTLKITATDDCGATYSFNLYKKQGSLLNTTTSSSSFTPSQASDWKLETIDISQLRNKKVIFNIESVNRHGSNLFIDNLHIYAGNNISTNNIDDQILLKVYPNPANEMITIDFKENIQQNISIEVIDMLGKRLFKTELENQKEGKFNIDISDFESGMYFVKYSNNKSSKFVKIVKK